MSAETSWSEWVGKDDQWDAQLLQLAQPCVYQSASWAKHRENFGWSSIRLKNSTNSCLVQLLHKSIFGTSFVWVPGGPVGDFGELTSDLVEEISRLTKSRRLYIRINSLQASDKSAEKHLTENNWRRVKQKFSSSKSLNFSLRNDEPRRRVGLSANWDRNLRRGETRNNAPYLWQTVDPTQVANLYQQLSDYKNLKPDSDLPSFETISSLISCCKNNLHVYRCDDELGQPIALRGALVFGNNAWDIFAAVSPQGRKQYSSYITAWALFNHCAELNIANYDLSGIDPIKNKGVYDFKHGTGATEIKYIGEWDRGTPFFIQPVVGRLLKYRKNL